MSLQFYYGSARAKVSEKLYQDIVERSILESDTMFLILVPDQFTMQTQKNLVMMHPRGGIMNVDVLSFGRLSHRIFEEVGRENTPILDDTGKSLILRKVAATCKERLQVLGSNLDKQGYIHEVKSAISEFMQYGIEAEDVAKLVEFSSGKGALSYKLQDLEILYSEFLEYLKGKFITTEETLDYLRKALHKSALIQKSVVIFDGFTGFTPIQNNLIQEIMMLAKEVIVSCNLDCREDAEKVDGEQKLFYLSKKTMQDLDMLARQVDVKRKKDVVLQLNERDELTPLGHLEQNLFRYPVRAYEKGDAGKEICLLEAINPKEEVRQCALKIRQLIRNEGYCFRDIAVICGDLDMYGDEIETSFSLFDIPCFIDQTRGIRLNPFIEYIKSALGIVIQDFSYESVFHYLRSGLADFTSEETDILENYVIQLGIRGKRKWSKVFPKHMKDSERAEESFQFINTLRERVMEDLRPLLLGKSSVTIYVHALYDFLIQHQVQEKLEVFEKDFQEQGDYVRAKEYGQIYRLVMDLLDQIIALLPDEVMTLQEFADILKAGFDEIEVGTIPQNVDHIVVGDMERTRLKEIKALLFLGMNDGNIPRNTSKGGIISDIDREFLQESEYNLAPTPRQQMFIQRFYLYLNLTKPEKKLFLSYSKVNGEGKAIRPAYLIETMKKLFPGLQVEKPWQIPLREQLETWKEGLSTLAEGLRNYANGYGKMEEEKTFFFTLYETYREETEKQQGQHEQHELRSEKLQQQLKKLIDAAFFRYENHPLSKVVAGSLYGQHLTNSVSRLETFAACAYHHFLQYGLELKERQEYEFEAVDMGNVFHGVLELFAHQLEEKGLTWFDFTKEAGETLMGEALQAYVAEYGDAILFSSARNRYAIERMKRILDRTALGLQDQLKKGAFLPSRYEMSFSTTQDLEAVNIALSEQEKMKLQGRIDRIDTYEDDSHVYVKVIDYKSGNKKFDLVALYYGLQLQLVVYLNAALEMEKKNNPSKEVIPAALLYYHIQDPMVEVEGEITPEALNEKLLAELRMNGVVQDSPDIIEKLDSYMTGKSDIIPVEKKKDGSLSARSSVMSKEQMQVLSDYVNDKIKTIGKEILAGKIDLNPYERGNQAACTYCAYQSVCGFDEKLPGFQKRKLEDLDEEEMFRRMEDNNGDTVYTRTAKGH